MSSRQNERRRAEAVAYIDFMMETESSSLSSISEAEEEYSVIVDSLENSDAPSQVNKD